jgi:hypothetical protein
MVILTLVYKIETGNLGVGMEVIHSLKSGWSVSASWSTSCSSLGIQDRHKWQFSKMTQFPWILPLSIMFSAAFWVPAPSEID